MSEKDPTAELLESLSLSIKRAATLLDVTVDEQRLATIAVTTLQKIEREQLLEPRFRWGGSDAEYFAKLSKKKSNSGLTTFKEIDHTKSAVGLVLWGTAVSMLGNEHLPMALDLIKITEVVPNKYNGTGAVIFDSARIDAFKYGTATPAADPFESSHTGTNFQHSIEGQIFISDSFS